MAMTLAEFVAPLKHSTIQNRILAIMYFSTVHEQGDVFGSEDIHKFMVKIRDAKKDANIAMALNQLTPRVELVGRERGKNLWRITDSGKNHIRELLSLPAETIEAQNEVASLTAIANKIKDEIVRDYVIEGLECLRFNALRAAIVFLWSGSVRTIQEEILKRPLTEVNASLQKANPKSKIVKEMDDFASVKDSQLLQTARDLHIFDKAQHRVLSHCLDLRNDSGHPTKYKPRVQKVKSFIEDIIGIVWR